MSKPFDPSFKDFQRDIESYLKSTGQCEKNERGQTVFRGYEAAVRSMFERYLAAKEFDPLVKHFRKWNWEWSYNDYLRTLISAFERENDWPHLAELWSAVVAKRRTNYNKTLKARRSYPDKIPQGTVEKTKALLIESLDDFETYAEKLGKTSGMAAYLEMKDRVLGNKTA